METTEFLDIKKAAEFLYLSKSALYKLAESRQLPHFQHGQKGKLYFRKNDLITYVESGLQSTKGEKNND